MVVEVIISDTWVSQVTLEGSQIAQISHGSTLKSSNLDSFHFVLVLQDQ